MAKKWPEVALNKAPSHARVALTPLRNDQEGSLLRVRLTALKMPMPRKIKAPIPM